MMIYRIFYFMAIIGFIGIGLLIFSKNPKIGIASIFLGIANALLLWK